MVCAAQGEQHRTSGCIGDAALGARRGDQGINYAGGDAVDVAHLGGQAAEAITVAVAVPLLGALVSVGTDHSGNLQLHGLLQAVARQLGGQLTGSAALLYSFRLESGTIALGYGSCG